MTNKKKTNESNDSKQITPKSNKIIHAEENNEFDDLSYNGNISTLDHLSKNIYKSNMAFDSPYSNLLKSASKNYHNLYNNTSPGNVLENLMFYNQNADTHQRSSALVFESNIRSSKVNYEDTKHSHNVIGDFLLSSPFNKTNNSPESINHNNIFSHNLELFKTPLKTPVLNLNKSVSQSNMKLLSNQQSSINNLFNNDMTHFNQIIQELQSPSVVINNAKEMRKEKKRTLKNELNNDICKTDEENSEDTIELSYTESVHKDQLVSSPLISKLKKSGNKLPKIPRKLNNTSKLPRMGSFTTNSQSRLTSLNNTTLNSSGTQNEESDHVLNKSIVLPKTKKVKKKSSQKQKKYQIVLKFPETF